MLPKGGFVRTTCSAVHWVDVQPERRFRVFGDIGNGVGWEVIPSLLSPYFFADQNILPVAVLQSSHFPFEGDHCVSWPLVRPQLSTLFNPYRHLMFVMRKRFVIEQSEPGPFPVDDGAKGRAILAAVLLSPAL